MKDKGGAVWIARQCQQIFVAAFVASDPGKAVMQDAAIEVAEDDLSHIGPEKAIFFSKTLIIDLLKRLEMVFNTLVILRVLWFARAIDRRCAGHKLCLPTKNRVIPGNIYCKLYCKSNFFPAMEPE